MAEPVFNVRNQGRRLAQEREHAAADLQVGPFGVAAQAIRFADAAVQNGRLDAAAMVFNMDPIAGVQSVAVDRDGLVEKRGGDRRRNEFFRMLIRTVIVRAIGDGDRQAVSVEVSADQMVGGGFRGRIRTLGGEGGRFIELARFGKRERAKNLVGGNMVETNDLAFAAARFFKQRVRSQNIGFKEYLRVGNRTVDVRLGGKMHDNVNVVHREFDGRRVCNVAANESDARCIHALEIRLAAGVSQRIKHDHAGVIMMRKPIANEIRTDESGAAGHKEFHNHQRMMRRATAQ